MSAVVDFEVHQEADVVPAGILVRVGVVGIFVGVVGVFAAGLLLAVTVGSVQPSFAGPSGPAPVARTISGVEQTPIWQSKAGEDLRDQQRRELGRWSWVDRKAGLANIPIDRAMDLVVEESR
jgi:hypothetical protein